MGRTNFLNIGADYADRSDDDDSIPDLMLRTESRYVNDDVETIDIDPLTPPPTAQLVEQLRDEISFLKSQNQRLYALIDEMKIELQNLETEVINSEKNEKKRSVQNGYDVDYPTHGS